MALYAFYLENAVAINTVGIAAAEVAGGLPSPIAPEVAAVKTIAAETGAVQAFNSYRQAKSVLGTQPNTQIHHVVEQCQANANRSGFPRSLVNSTDNLVRLSDDIHNQISRFYSSSIYPGGGTFRDSLNGLPFDEQFNIGVDVMQRAINGTLK